MPPSRKGARRSERHLGEPGQTTPRRHGSGDDGLQARARGDGWRPRRSSRPPARAGTRFGGEEGRAHDVGRSRRIHRLERGRSHPRSRLRDRLRREERRIPGLRGEGASCGPRRGRVDGREVRARAPGADRQARREHRDRRRRALRVVERPCHRRLRASAREQDRRPGRSLRRNARARTPARNAHQLGGSRVEDEGGRAGGDRRCRAGDLHAQRRGAVEARSGT